MSSSDSSDDSSDSPALKNILLDNGFSLGTSATICPSSLKHCYNFTKNLKNYNDLCLIGFSETRHRNLASDID
ncbi:hypothetical protein T07_8134 [Trichinella nelsoni]|uniref:Uncharacterized protein n=1 Tax=Trichinella nelsoni TaxID=6336 RepID=A0A0V0S6D4_9BILA|nr:hypothetical protein T07_8134 [Trichinella nelsoni]